MNKKVKVLRLTTVPMSLKFLLKGQLRYMSTKGFEVFAASADGTEVKDVVENEGCSHSVFMLTRTITPVTDLITLFRLSRWIRKEKFDIVHTHTPKAGLIGMLAARLAGTKIRLHTIAGLPWMEATGFKRQLLKSVDKLGYAAANGVYPNSHGLLNFAINEKLAPQKKMKVIASGSSNGIDTDFFSADQVNKSKEELRQELGIGSTDFIFCFVGRIVRDKGMNELAKAFQQMPENAHLVLVGPFEDELDPLAPDTKLFFEESESVHMAGYQNDVRPYLKLSDALVFPSYREGFPNVPMQAGALGLPSIVTDINGCNEIVRDQENGLLIKPKDGDSLHKAMNVMLNNKDLYRSMQQKARPMISNRYEQRVVWQALHEEYLRLLN